MIQQGGADDWTRVIDKFMEIDEISADSLLSFFSPLEDFIYELEEDFEYKTFNPKESELEELEKKIVEELNVPSTTTTTTARSLVTERKMTNTTPLSQENDKRDGMIAVDSSNNKIKSEERLENRKESEASTKVPFDESLHDNIIDLDENKKPKINTSKAVWAVGAVLLATIVICIIAIFGRQRCRKTPKNRRYV